MLVVAALFVDRIPQDTAYHQFADTRTILGIVNFWNVFSNLFFVITGGIGLWFLRQRDREGIIDRIYPVYVVFFSGVLATGLGSAWYHFSPDNSTLVWDRLTMTVAFMAYFAMVVGEHVSDTSARRLLIPLLVSGAASVFYWQYTEATGAGDLRPYALVQFLPMILIPVILIAYRPLFGSSKIFWVMILFYAISKLFEYLDHDVFAAGHLLSGHSVKHIVAAIAPLVLLHNISKRRLPVHEDRADG